MKTRFTTLDWLIIVGFLLLIACSITLTFWRVDVFPFSTYRMYSESFEPRFRLTLLTQDLSGTAKLIDPALIAPVRRLHLHYLLREASAGNPIAVEGLSRFIHGIFLASPTVAVITVAQVRIDRDSEAENGFRFELIKQLRVIKREDAVTP